jgi:hypothetical protein
MYNQYRCCNQRTIISQRGTCHFLYSVLWTEEAVLTRSGVLTVHNMRAWATQNLRATRDSSFQQDLMSNFGRNSIWMHVTQDRLGGPHYADSTFVWGCASSITVSLNMFRVDCAVGLATTFRIDGLRAEVQSPDFHVLPMWPPSEFYSWGCLKDQDCDDLIQVTGADIRNLPVRWVTVRGSIQPRCEACAQEETSNICCVHSVRWCISPHHKIRMCSKKALWSGEWKMLQSTELFFVSLSGNQGDQFTCYIKNNCFHFVKSTNSNTKRYQCKNLVTINTVESEGKIFIFLTPIDPRITSLCTALEL